jgi:hypothetical protein
MLEFCKLLKNGKDKASVLKQAQIKITQNERHLHSYF